MKLEKFTKNKNKKRILIGSIIILLLLVGGIYLYRTYAFYEEKKEFNVLKGRVPDFSNWDIWYKVDDEARTKTKPTDGSAKYVSIDCGDGVDKGTYSWDDTNAKVNYSVSNLKSKNPECTVNYSKYLNNVARVGDYVSYTPSSTSYTISKSLTGYSNDQTIYPRELNLWRVIRKNGDGTIDIVSEYASSSTIYFTGASGYTKFVGTLNTIAAQYANKDYTIATRHMGYSNQVGICSAYNSSNCADTNGYAADYNLVKTAMGRIIVYKPNTTTATPYWLVSRNYQYVTSSDFRYQVLSIKTDGTTRFGRIYTYYNGEWASYSEGPYSIRPIITIKAKFIPSYVGTKKDSNQNKTFNHWKVN